MKTIEVIRGGMEYPLILSNGDRYDSTVEIFDSVGRKIKNYAYVNTDKTTNYDGGKLAKGNYYAIVGIHRKKYKALILFNAKNDNDALKIKSYTDLTKEKRTFISEIPNKNHGGKNIITYINFHRGGLTWDYSHGCLTMLYNSLLIDSWHDFMSVFEMGEVVKLTLK